MFGDVGQFGKEFGVIAIIVGIRSGIAGGEDTGSRVQGIDIQAGVICQGPQAAQGRVVQSFEVGVLGKSTPGLNGLGQRVDIPQANKLKVQIG